MISVLNELTRPVRETFGSPRAATGASGGFGAALARSVAATADGETSPTARPVPGGAPSSIFSFPARGGALPAPEGAARDAVNPAADAKALHAPDPLPSALPSVSPASENPTLPGDPAAPPELGPTAPAKATPRKAGPTPEAKRPDPAEGLVAPPPAAIAPPIVAPLPPALPPPGTTAEPGGGEQDATASAGGNASPSTPVAGPPASPDASPPASNALSQPGGDFRAQLSNAPPTPAPPPAPSRGKSGVALQDGRASPPGAHGDALGLQIVRHIAAGKDALSIALTPETLGRVEVQMRFDDAGTLRAVVSASTPEALALLHRDSPALDQAMLSAGVRTDAQSFQFDSRAGNRDDRPPEPRTLAAAALADLPDAAEAALIQPLRNSGTLDLLA